MQIEVKICGLTNADDARCALDSGADYLGFVLYPDSPRGISAQKMLEILDELEQPVKAVGVFVNEDREFVQTVADDAGLFAAQIHGDEDAAMFEDMPLPLWRAVRIEEGVCRPDPAEWQAVRYVVDAAVPGLYGGTGIAADWGAAARMAESLPLMLAGGLTPENVAEAIRTVRPLGVDTAGGVEREPGQKDRDKVRKFVEAAKRMEIG